MSEHYVIISADGHCGLPLAGLPALSRGSVPPRLRRVGGPEGGGARGQARDELRVHHGLGDLERGGPAGRVRPRRSATVSSTRTACRPTCCSRMPTRSPAWARPRSAPAWQRARSTTPTWPSPAPGRTTASWPSCARRARSAGPASRSSRCATTRPGRWTRRSGPPAQPGIRGVMIPTMWRDRAPYSSEVYEPFWAACAAARPAGAHPLGRGTAGGLQRASRHLPRRSGVVGGATVVAPVVLRGLRAPPGAHVRGHRGRRLLDRRLQVEVGPVHGRRTHHQEDGGPPRGEDLEAALGVLRHQPLRRARRRCRRRRSAAATSSASTR